MTSHWIDFQNTDVILHCGSNSVENHPLSSRWLNKAHENGAKWIVVDPRYTRTAEMADIYCPIVQVRILRSMAVCITTLLSTTYGSMNMC